MITALCTSKNTVYKKLGIPFYDEKRNTRTFTGTGPVIAHPPCRGYSAYMGHWAKPPPGEKDLALFCTERIKNNGGVLEHPAHSTYLKRFINSSEWKITRLKQSWFGNQLIKNTWLLTPGHYEIPEFPFELMPQNHHHIDRFDNLSKNQRSETTLQFAKYLISIIILNQTRLTK